MIFRFVHIGAAAIRYYPKQVLRLSPPPDFDPFREFANHLLSQLPDHSDGSHDHAHLYRVWQLVKRLQQAEGGSLEILLAATLLHDAINIEKSSGERAQASSRSAAFAKGVLQDFGWSFAQSEQVAHAIEAHSYSANVAPKTLEAQILQDADRLDAIGALGIARCFYTAGRLQLQIYDPNDPLARGRDLDDTRFAVDHFGFKLLNLGAAMNTATATSIALRRHEMMRRFIDELYGEIGN